MLDAEPEPPGVIVPRTALPPAMPLMSQTNAALLEAHTEAVKAWVLPSATFTAEGETEPADEHAMVTEALPNSELFAVFVAVMLTDAGDGRYAGAV